MDKVFINNLAVEAIIGIFQWEREVRQLISIDIEMDFDNKQAAKSDNCLLYTSPSPRDATLSRMPSSA